MYNTEHNELILTIREENIQLEVKLDRECWRCDKTGKYNKNKCDVCGGVGYILTDNGYVILNLIKRHQVVRDVGE